MEKFIVYNNFMGTPEKVVYLDGKWWKISRDAELEPLPEPEYGDDYYRNLCSLDEVITMPDLACMMGCSIFEFNSFEIKDVFEDRLKDLLRLGVKINADPQQMDVTVSIVENPKAPEHPSYRLSCYDSNDEWRDYILHDNYAEPFDAMKAFKAYLQFFKNHGVTFHTTLRCTDEIYSEVWELAMDMEYEEIPTN